MSSMFLWKHLIISLCILIVMILFPPVIVTYLVLTEIFFKNLKPPSLPSCFMDTLFLWSLAHAFSLKIPCLLIRTSCYYEHFLKPQECAEFQIEWLRFNAQLKHWARHLTLYSHSASLHQGVQMGTVEFNAGGINLAIN